MIISKKAFTILAAFMIGISGIANGTAFPSFISKAEAQYNPNPRPLPPNAPPKLKETCNAINKSGCTKMIVTPLPGGSDYLCSLYDKNGNCMKNAIIPRHPNVPPEALQPYLSPEIKVNKPYDPLRP